MNCLLIPLGPSYDCIFLSSNSRQDVDPNLGLGKQKVKGKTLSFIAGNRTRKHTTWGGENRKELKQTEVLTDTVDDKESWNSCRGWHTGSKAKSTAQRTTTHKIKQDMKIRETTDTWMNLTHKELNWSTRNWKHISMYSNREHKANYGAHKTIK